MQAINASSRTAFVLSNLAMKPLNSLLLVSLLMVLPCAAQQIPVASSIGYEAANQSNTIVLTWESIPTKLYNVLTTTALGQQPWVPLNPSPIYSSNNLVRYRDTNNQPARFYKVVKLDTDPPEIWRLNPGSNSIAVARQSSLKAWLRDETAIDPASIVLTVGTNPPATLADPRLTYTNGTLIYTPATNQFHGTNTQIVSASLAVSDPLNHRSTNSWSFQIEQVPVIAANVLLIGGSPAISAASFGAAASPGLMLVSTNGDIFKFSYTGTSSGLSTGQILVSADTNFLYKRKVISFTEDSASHTVSVTTEIASLAECLQQGSVRLTGDFGEQVATGFQAAGAGQGTIRASIPLDGTMLINSGSIRVEVVSGQISFTPGFTVSGEFTGGRLVSFDSEISGTLGLDMTLRGSLQATGDWSDALPLTTPVRRFKLLGFVGVVPVWAEAVLEFNIGYEVHAEAVGAVTAGFESSRTLTFGARLRDGQWNLNHPPDSSTLLVREPTWEITGAGNVTVYVEPKLTIYLESLAGLSVNLKRYLEVEGNASVQPGRAGVNLSLYSGLSSTLAVDVRGWDEDWGTLPSWELFNLRERIYHKDLSTSIGSSPQTIPNMAWIPSGTFTMGSPASEPARYDWEGPQTRVTISQGIWMGKYEVTQGEYVAVMGSNPSYFQEGLSRPVEDVSWDAAVNFCTALTTRERNAGRLPAGYVYRLPTEAEWEYACRAGTSTAFHYGDALRSGMANFQGNLEYPPCAGAAFPYGCYNPSGTYLSRTTTVGSYAPNAWGLYDMHGNVVEWCSDSWSASLPGGSVTDPQGPATGSYRVVRGGGWNYYAIHCRSAHRAVSFPECESGCFIGFRVVLAPGQQ